MRAVDKSLRHQEFFEREIISEKFLGMPRIKPGAAGREASVLSTVLCGHPTCTTCLVNTYLSYLLFSPLPLYARCTLLTNGLSLYLFSLSGPGCWNQAYIQNCYSPNQWSRTKHVGKRKHRVSTLIGQVASHKIGL